ncbi:hypothetical protein [Thiopseudomonas alkaliphila]|uniref:hypothetical protein n=1 Tax=Thiopseudomonas alkaliphila TaxID=1697053 RepID=UPI0025763D11|nr:hypothetical protein [Thiopseudomonas alkaliphila]MDM1717366.1 hypothetical protein [Thiopseudomonas alkaliphila]
MLNTQENYAMYCPVTQELITSDGDFIPLPESLKKIMVGKMTKEKAQILKSWAVRSKHINQNCKLDTCS